MRAARVAVAIAAMLLVAGALAQGVARVPGPIVEINGQRWEPAQPPLRMKGEIFVPLRELVELLGGQLSWDEQHKKAEVKIGQAQLVLWLGRQFAVINGEPVELPFAPMTVNDTLYAPLGAIVIALDGQAEWDAASETMRVEVQAPGIRAQLVGTLVQVFEGRPPVLIVYEPASQKYRAITLADNAAIRVQRPGMPLLPANVRQLQPGDELRITLDENERAVAVTARYAVVEGEVQFVGENQVVLAGGARLKLMSIAKVVDERGREVPADRLGPGARVRARINPSTKETARIILLRPAPRTGELRITAAYIVNRRAAYRPGQRIEVRVLASPGARVWCSIGRALRNLPLREVAPGRYEATIILPAEAQGQQWLSVTAERGGQRVTRDMAADKFWIDGQPPRILRVAPEDGSTAAQARPAIQVQFRDNESGIDRRSVALIVDARDVTEKARITNQFVVYQPDSALKPGEHSVRVRVADLAGNRAERSWRFKVAQPTHPVRYVKHNAAKVLCRGDVLKVWVGVARRGRRCWVEVDGLRMDLQPNEAGTEYSGEHRIAAGEVVRDGRLTVHFVDADGREWVGRGQTRIAIRGDLPGGVEITSPQEGQRVTGKFEVQGLARPGSRVRVVVTFYKKRALLIQFDVADETVTVDEEGRFKVGPIEVEQPLWGRPDKFIIRAIQLDESGQPASEAKIEVPAR